MKVQLTMNIPYRILTEFVEHITHNHISFKDSYAFSSWLIQEALVIYAINIPMSFLHMCR